MPADPQGSAARREDILNALTGVLRRVEQRHVAGIAEPDTRAAADELLIAIWPLVESNGGTHDHAG